MTTVLQKISKQPKDDILSGLTVALALVPEAVAFAFVAGVNPIVGLYGAFMMGIITAIFGGRPGMISGATGAMAVVMVDLVAEGNLVGANMQSPVEELGTYWLFFALLIVGGIQVLAGALKLGKFVRLIPHPVMMGFVNGLAIVIFLAQLNLFKDTVNGEKQWLATPDLLLMLGLVGFTMLIMWLLPKLTTKVPSALVAIITVAAITILGNLDVSTVGSFIRDNSPEGATAGLQGTLPVFESATFSYINTLQGHWALLFKTAVLLAAVGLIESLMTLNLIDELTESRGSGNRECVAQGGANILNGLFGGMGGCAMIGQSIINIESGGRGRLSGIVAAIALLAFILFAAPLIEQIPIAALVGVMFMVVIGTFAWSSFRIINKIPKADAIVLITVSVVTVLEDLAIAVVIGVIMSALVFAWENATMIRARKRFKDNGIKVYEIWGPLFFGSVQTFVGKFDAKNDPEAIEIDFIESKVSDHSGIEAIRTIANRYLDLKKQIKLTHLSPECQLLLLKANPRFSTIIETSVNDPRYYVATSLVDHDSNLEDNIIDTAPPQK
ncbi:MAG: SulP family inorganic anion transporter [Aureispira sp.]